MKNILKNKSKKLALSVVLSIIVISAIVVCTNIFSTSSNQISNSLFTDEYIKAGAEGKFGLIDNLGKTIMPFKYDDVVYDSHSQTAAVMLDSKWGFADKNGDIKVKVEYDEVGMFGKSDLAPVKKGDKWGYVDKNGKLAVECKYYTATNFADNGLAAVTGDEWPYYINEKGEKAFDMTYDMLGEFNDNGYAVVSSKEKFGIINSKGKEIVELKYGRDFSVDDDGFAVVSFGEKYGVIDVRGNEIVPFENEYIMPTVTMYNSADLNSGFAKAYYTIFLNQLLEKHNLFDDNNIAIVVKDGMAGLINSSGKIVLEPKFKELQVYNESGVVLVADGEKYMYYDINGKPLANGEKFDKTNGFNSGLGVVIKNSKWGYVDKKGEFAIEPQFTAAFGFAKNGLASVRKDDKWGYINKKGEFVIEPTYAYASTFVQNIAKVNDGISWGIIRSDGSKVCTDLPSEPAMYSDGYAVVESKDGKFALYDLDGNLIAKTKCDMIGSNHKSSKLCQVNGCYNVAVEETTYCTEHGVQ